MLIISWNVAGLSTTLQRINRDYSSSSSNSSTTSSSSKKNTEAFTTFLHRHGNPDILCIQEHKIPQTQLSSRSEPYNCTSIPGYESFWSCNNTTEKSKKGFNGVVTYVKTGLTQSASCTPFNNHDLDCQGRCIMTDHGSFVIFNVYVPAGGANPLGYKMKFLNALRDCMKVQREEYGKKVLLVGDLNICHGGLDEHWKYRSIYVDGIVKEIQDLQQQQQQQQDAKSSSTVVPKWKLDLYQHWNTITSVLSTLEAIPITTKNQTTGSTSDKYRARVTLQNGEGRKIQLGKAESSPEECLYNYIFEEKLYHDHELDKEVVARKKNVVPLTVLYELMSKIGKVDWGTSVLNGIANTDYALKKTSPQSKWLSRLIDEDDMVDAFRMLYPLAQGR